jgi:hypothetical protein
MCDYSLAVLPNRLAVEGEELVVHQFHTGAKGLASPVDLRVAELALRSTLRRSFWEWLKGVFEDLPHAKVAAVCVPPGAQLLLKNIPRDLQREWRIGEQEGVSFVQVSATENTYRDAVQFRQGSPVLLQNLHEGMLVQVLSLGGIEVNDDQYWGSRTPVMRGTIA